MRYAYGADDPICGVAVFMNRHTPNWYDESEPEENSPKLPTSRAADSLAGLALLRLARQNSLALRVRECLMRELDEKLGGEDLSKDELEWLSGRYAEHSNYRDAFLLVNLIEALEPLPLSELNATAPNATFKPFAPWCPHSGSVRFAP